MGSKFKLALIQLAVGSNKAENLSRALAKISEAVNNGAQVVSLPECFNSPYGTKYFQHYAEPVPQGPSCQALQETARKHQIYLIGGSIPEVADGRLFNTATVWCPEGKLLAIHRKMHLFDIDIPGKITFKESDSLSPGNSPTTFSTPWCDIGIGICYDIRFAELAQIYRKKGCKLLIYPGAFNMTTGPAHWELLARARALDNQVYVATPSPARSPEADYTAWGHSSVVNPWGEVVATTDEQEGIVYSDIDLQQLDTIRQQIPIGQQRREDIYEVRLKLDEEKEKLPRLNTMHQLDCKKVVDTFNVEELDKRMVLCRCWQSSKFPYCDGAHGRHNQDTGDNLGPVIIKKA